MSGFGWLARRLSTPRRSGGRWKPPGRGPGPGVRRATDGGFTVVEAMVGTLVMAVALASLFAVQGALIELDGRRRLEAEIGAQLLRVAEQSRAMGHNWWRQQVEDAPGQEFSDIPYAGSGFSVRRSASRVTDEGVPEGLIRVTVEAVTPSGRVRGRVAFFTAESGL